MIQALKEMAKRTTTWRVLRLYHPIFNIQGDFNNNEKIWMVKVSVRESILHLSQKARISLVLASHNHNAQFMAIPYKVTDNIFAKMPDPNKNL